MMLRSVVVFPAPFLPIRETTSFSPISIDTSLRIWLALIKTLMLSTLEYHG